MILYIYRYKVSLCKRINIAWKNNVKYVSTTEQVADMYTKPLNKELLLKFCERCGISNK